jgi:short subunit dehydrogenase-like uncharacterized protein
VIDIVGEAMNRILLYGATGYIGRLIAQEAARRIARGDRLDGLTLASRDQRELRKLAEKLRLPYLAFSLDDRAPAVHALERFNVVINAAGPFSLTASRLAKAALDRFCHYVDLNDELDVYTELDDLGPIAETRGVAIVCGAGWTSTAADVLLAHAFDRLRGRRGELPDPPPANIEVAYAMPTLLSRGSVSARLRSIREQVTVVRGGKVAHVPAGRFERKFGLDIPAVGAPAKRVIATAITVPDTLVLNRSAHARAMYALDITAYLEMDGLSRLAYQAATFGAAAMYLPFAQRAIGWQTALLPEGPTDEQRKQSTATLALIIEDAWRRTIASYVLCTPNSYDFSACSALEIALRLAPGMKGWRTPSSVLQPDPLVPARPGAPFGGSVIYDALASLRTEIAA